MNTSRSEAGEKYKYRETDVLGSDSKTGKRIVKCSSARVRDSEQADMTAGLSLFDTHIGCVKSLLASLYECISTTRGQKASFQILKRSSTGNEGKSTGED